MTSPKIEKDFTYFKNINKSSFNENYNFKQVTL